MAITLKNADAALKTFYLDAVSDQLNNGISPFYAAIEKSTADVWGKEVKRLVSYGVNGGIGAGTEDGNLPTAAGNNYAQFTTTLKNLYGVIEISDKAIRASENKAGAFVNLLDAEMEGLIKASRFNFGRMLYGSGLGLLGTVVNSGTNYMVFDSVQNMAEGMVIEFRDNVDEETDIVKRIISVDRVNNTIFVDGNISIDMQNYTAYLQGSEGNELSGLGTIFNNKNEIYGYDKDMNAWIKPYDVSKVGAITEDHIQIALDEIEQASGNTPNLIICSWGVRRALLKLFAENKRIVNSMEIAGGFNAISYNGIPIVTDRFCPKGTMYMLNTNDFTLHQLCDWQWLESDDGSILKQVPGKPVYTATLVKYADLLCTRPCGQGRLRGITEA